MGFHSNPWAKITKPSGEDVMKVASVVAGKMKAQVPPHVMFDDLVQAAALGAWQAAERWDPTQGSFEAYAYPRAQGSVLDWLRSEDVLTKNARKDAKDITKTITELRSSNGKEPSEQEIASKLGWSIDEYNSKLAASATPVFITEIWSEEGESSDIYEHVKGEEGARDFSERIFTSSFGADPALQVEDSEIIALMASAIDSLPEKERLILSLIHDEGLSQKEAAYVMSISEPRVCQLMAQAQNRLKSILSGQPISRRGRPKKEEEKC